MVRKVISIKAFKERVQKGLKKYDRVRAQNPNKRLQVRDAINRSVMNFALDCTIHTMIPKNIEMRKKVRRLIKDFVWASKNHELAKKSGEGVLERKTLQDMAQFDEQFTRLCGSQIRCIDFVNKFNSTWTELQKYVYDEATKTH